MIKHILLLTIAVILGATYYLSEITIHIIRHGEKIIAKSLSDAPLTDLGKLQAKNLGEYLVSKHKITKLYSSPMRRTRQTSKIISKFTGSFIDFDERLTEKNYRKSDAIYADGTHVYIKFLSNGKKETKDQHLKRLLGFFQNKVGIFEKELWLVSHGGVIHRIFEKISEDTKQELSKVKINYCSTFTFKYNKITKTFRYLGQHDVQSLK